MNRWIFFLIAAFTPFIVASQALIQYAVPPIYHANGILASNGNAHYKFHHDNGQIAWFGMDNVDPRVFHHNGELAWRGHFNNECAFTYSCCSIYHNNGETMWKGASYKDAIFSNGPCSIYHSNGALAWKGALSKDCTYTYGASTVYFRNGAVAWKGISSKGTFYADDSCSIFHSNGTPAWRGLFAFETYSQNKSAVFHDNGNLAWGGKYGDPIFDRHGFIITATAEAINMPIGENSWLYLTSNGVSNLHVSLGDESFLTFSNQDQNPRLLVHLGTGLNLECFPYTGDMSQITIYGTAIPVRDFRR